MNNNSNYFKIYKTTLSSNLIAFILFSIILIIYRLPVLEHLNTHLFGGSKEDAGLYYWLFNFNKASLVHSWYDTILFYPYTGTLAWSDNFIIPSLVTTPLDWLGLSTTAQYNLILLLALNLNSFFTFLLSYRLTGKFLASLTVGIFILFSSYINENLGHPQLLFIFWIPLTLIWLANFYNSKQLRWLLICSLTISFCFLTTVYYALFLVIFIIVTCIALHSLNPSYLEKKYFPHYIGMFSLGLLPLIPFLLPYFNTQDLFGKRALFEAFYFSASAPSFISASGTNYIYGQLLSLNFSEFKSFDGLILTTILALSFYRLYDLKESRKILITSLCSFISAIILTSFDLTFIKFIATILVWLSIISFLIFISNLGKAERALGSKIFTNRNFIALFLFLIIFFTSLSLGPIINPNSGFLSFSPFTFLYYLLPGVSSIRSVDRFFVIALLFNVFLIPFTVQYYLSKFKNIKVFQVGLIFLIVFEQYCNLYPLEELPGFNYPITELNKLVVDIENRKNVAIIVLPIQDTIKPSLDPTTYANYNIRAALWALNSNFKLVNGYSGQVPKLHKTYIDTLKNFPDDKSLNELRKISNLRFIKLYGKDIINFSDLEFEERLKNFSEIKIISKDLDNTYILEFTPVNELNSTFYIPNKNGIFEFEAKTNDNNSCIVEVYNKNNNILLNQFLVNNHLDYKLYSLPIAKTSNSQKPITLELVKKCIKNAFVVVKNTRFIN
jgi:hypothetical protein